MNIKNIRKSIGMTQKELAEKSGVSFSMVSKLESGEKKNPSFDTLNKIAAALKVNTNELLSDTIDEPYNNVTSTFYDELLKYANLTNRNFGIEYFDDLLVIIGEKVNSNNDPYFYKLTTKEQKILFDRIINSIQHLVNTSLYEHLISCESKEGE